MQKPIARLVIKDLITGDSSKKEITLLNDKITLLTQKISLKDSIIFTYQTKEETFKNILDTQEEQLILSRELSKKLEIDLKKQKFKNKLTIGGGILAVIGTFLLLQ